MMQDVLTLKAKVALQLQYCSCILETSYLSSCRYVLDDKGMCLLDVARAKQVDAEYLRQARSR